MVAARGDDTIRLAFWTSRLNHLRQLGPIAAAARRRGHSTFFICPSGGPKEDATDHLLQVEMEGGGPAIEVDGATDAIDVLTRYSHAGAVMAVGLRQPSWVRQHVMPETRRHGIQWCSVGYLAEEYLHVLENGPAILGEWDVVTTASWEGVDWLAERLIRMGNTVAAREVRRRFVATGYPALDPLISLDKATCRAKHGLPPTGRVLLFVPAARPHLMAPWRRWVFDGPLSPFAQTMGKVTYRVVAGAVLRYANRHNAIIVVKTRAKNPDPPWFKAMGRVIGDRSWHPSTTLELVTATDAHCGFASAFAIEASAAHLRQTHFLAWPLKSAEHPMLLDFRERFYLGDGPWERVGLAQTLHLYRRPWQLERWAENAPWSNLADTQIAARALEPLVGTVDGKASDRILDQIERRTEGHSG